tara:strand:- start:333 stop:551 length:219 start_codon:yes stop_codon:yes gene_type:complete
MRDYKSEYANYHSKPKQKKDRAGRNGARRIMKKKYGNSILGRDVDHKDRNPRNNSKGNLRLQSKSSNRSRNQ